MKRLLLALVAICNPLFAQNQIPMPTGGGGGASGQYSTPSVGYTAGTYYFPAGGGLAANAARTNVVTPQGASGTISKFAVQIPAGTGSGSAVFTWFDGSTSQSVTCTAAASSTGCSDTTHTFNYAAGDLLSIQMVVSTATITSTVTMSWGTGQIGPTGPGGTGTAPYALAFTAATTVNVTAATHGQGTNPSPSCWDGPLVGGAKTGNQTSCPMSVNSAGDVTFGPWSTPFTGSGQIQGGGTGATGATGPTASTKVINGVSYSNQYTGATLDVRANACISDAETLANGNTSGICDSSGESGTQTIAAQISVGTTASAAVTWRLPASCAWNSTINNGTSSVIVQFPNTEIFGEAPHYSCIITQTVASTSGITGAFSVYTVGLTAGSDPGYYRASGFSPQTNVKTASGFNTYILAAFDNSVWRNIEVVDSASGDTAGLRIGGGNSIMCCSSTFENVTSNSGFTGPIPLDIEGASSGYTTALRFIGGSWDHPKAGQPNIKINDTVHNMSVDFAGVSYAEGNSADTSTVPVQISGAAFVHFTMFVYVPQMTGMTADVITASSANGTSLALDSFSSNGTLTSHVIVGDSTANCNVSGGSPPCNTSSDAYGNLSGYFNNFHPLQINMPFGTMDNFFSGLGLAVGVAFNSGNTNPIFAINTTDQSGGAHGVAGNMFNVQANKVVTTFNTVLDDGSGNMKIDNGANTVLRCTTAGTLPVGSLTITSADCTASVDTGLRVK